MFKISKNKQEIPRELSYFSLSDSAAQWEVTVAHKWKVVALELAAWMEDKYKQGLAKAQIKDYIHVSSFHHDSLAHLLSLNKKINK